MLSPSEIDEIAGPARYAEWRNGCDEAGVRIMQRRELWRQLVGRGCAEVTEKKERFLASLGMMMFV